MERVGRDELAVLAELDDDELRGAPRGGDFGGDGRHGDAGVRVVEPVVAGDAQHVLGELAAVQPARVAPNEATFADGHPRRMEEQAGDEISGEVRAGRPARTPETDVTHDASPELEIGRARSTPPRARRHGSSR